MSNKRKGTEYEREVRKLFESAGYEVTRAAGSLSSFDLVATKNTRLNTRKTYYTIYEDKDKGKLIVLMQQKIKKVR